METVNTAVGVMESIVEAHLDAIAWPVALLVDLCDATGLRWGPTSRERFWSRSPEQHVVEFILFHLFILALYLASKSYYRNTVTKARVRINPESALDTLLGVLFALCWMSQVVFKALRPQPLVQLCWMFMPCHLITLVWVYVLLSKGRPNFSYCVYLATLASVYHWGPVSAAAFPDWSDHKFVIEGPIFAVHHGLLVAMPFYWAFRYEILPMTWQLGCHMTWVATFINCGPYTLISYLSGLNVNYMLYPPPKVASWRILATPYYRFNVVAVLIVVSVVLWILFRAVNAIGNVVLGKGRKAASKPKSS